MHHPLDIVTHTTNKALLPHDFSTQVVTAVGVVSNPRETCFVGIYFTDMATHNILIVVLNHTTDIGLSMTQNVSITATSKGVENTTLSQIHIGITDNRTKEATTIHELAFGHIVTAIVLLGNTIIIALQVDIATIGRIIGIVIVLKYVVVVLRRIFIFVIFCHSGTQFFKRLANDSLFTATKNLEYITLVQVDCSATPYSGILTIAATKHVEGLTKHIHTLLAQDDTRVSLGNRIGCFCRLISSVQTDLLAQLIRHHFIEELFALHEGLVDVDDHITIDDTAVIATAIDIATRKATG